MKRWLLAGAVLGWILPGLCPAVAATSVWAADAGSDSASAAVAATSVWAADAGSDSASAAVAATLVWAADARPAGGAVEIVPWFTPRQLARIVDDPETRERLRSIGFRLIAYEGVPDAAAEWVEDSLSATWVPVHRGAFVTGAAETGAAEIEDEMIAFMEKWRRWGGGMDRWILLQYPDTRHPTDSEAIAGWIDMAAYDRIRDPAADGGASTAPLILLSVDQAVPAGLHPDAGMVIDCTDAGIPECLSRTSMAGWTGMRLRPTGADLDDLGTLEAAGNGLAARGGGWIMVDGEWLLDMLDRMPDLGYALEDWTKGGVALIPGGLDAPNGTHAGRPIVTIMILGILILFYSIMRRGSLYGQTLYRFFINHTFLDLESAERDILSGILNWLMILGYCTLVGILAAEHVGTLLPSIGLHALSVLHPFLFPGFEDPYWDVFLLASVAAFVFQIVPSLGVWWFYRPTLTYRRVLSATTWPFHLHGLWLLIDPAWLRDLAEPTVASAAMIVMLVASSMAFRLISMLNLAREAGSKARSMWIPFAGYLVSLLVIGLLVWRSALVQETIPFLLAF